MKQKEDTKTIDMFDAPKGAIQYKFWVSTREEYTEWTNLTAKRAKDMYAYTNQSQPSNVTSFGWEEMK